MHEQAAIVAVPDSNGIASGCRNLIALWIRLDRLPVAECLYSFAGFNDGCCPIVRCRQETDIGDIVEILCDKTFWYVFASHTNTLPQPVLAAIQWPSSDTATVDKLHLHLHRHHLFATVFHSPHSNPPFTASPEIAIRRERHCRYPDRRW